MKKPIERPSQGGSYVRQKDGTLKSAHKPVKEAAPAAQPASAKPADTKKGK